MVANENERVVCNKSDLVAIADAIRAITGSTTTYYVSELASHITLVQFHSLNVSHDGAGNVTLTIGGGEIVEALTAGEIDGMTVSVFESKLVSEVKV